MATAAAVAYCQFRRRDERIERRTGGRTRISHKHLEPVRQMMDVRIQAVLVDLLNPGQQFAKQHIALVGVK